MNKRTVFWSLSFLEAPPPPGPNEEVFEYEAPLEIFNEEIDLDAYDATDAPTTTAQPPIKGYGFIINGIR